MRLPGFACSEDLRARHQPSLKPHVASDREANVDIIEVAEQREQRRRREELKMRRVRFGMPPDRVAETTLQSKRVRYRADEAAAGLQHAAHVRNGGGRVGEMLEQLAGDDDVERVVREGKTLLDVGPYGLDPEPLDRLLEGAVVDVHADDLVSGGVVLCQRARAAAEVEHAQARPADEERDQSGTLVRAEYELPAMAVMRPVPRIEAVKPGHRRRCCARPRRVSVPPSSRRPCPERGTMAPLVATKPVVGVDTSSGDDGPPEPPVFAGDIRSVRLLPSGPQLRALARRAVSVAALVVIDLSGLAGSLYLALVLRELYYGERPILWGLPWDAEAKWLPFLALVTLLVFWRARLYAARELRAGAGRIVSSLLLVTVITLAFAVGTGYQHTTFGLYATAFVLSTIVIGLLRSSYEVVTGDVWRVAGVRRRAILVGEGERLASLRRALGLGRARIDYEFLGALSSDGEPSGLPVLGRIADLSRILRDEHPDELIVSSVDLGEEELLDLVEEAHRWGVKVRIAPTTTELLTQRGEYVAGQGVPLFELRPPVFAGLDWAMKRTFDAVVSAAMIIVAAPVWAAIALAVKLDSPGPVFYRDRRVGLAEREFGMFKFRSMYVDASERQAGLEQANEASGPLFKIKDDPRVTRVGRFLRRYSLDEFPQVINVMRGEMSLVGPRPLPLRDYVQLEDWHRKRYLVLPGMTGLWQVSGRIDLSFDDLVRLDFYYLENWSIWLDISILAKTLPAVLARRGAY